MSDTLDKLKVQAKELGIKFSPNIGEESLAKKIQDKLDEEENAPLPEVEDFTPVAAKATPKKTTKTEKAEDYRQIAKKLEEESRKTRIVTITDNDQRENNYTTTVTVTCGNEYFELGTVILPLNVPIEAMQGHLNVLKEIVIPMHKKVGNKTVTQIRKRYSLAFEDELKS